MTTDTLVRTHLAQAPRYRALDEAAVALRHDGGLGRLGNWSDLVNEYACLLLGGGSCDMRYEQETQGAPVKRQIAASRLVIL